GVRGTACRSGFGQRLLLGFELLPQFIQARPPATGTAAARSSPARSSPTLSSPTLSSPMERGFVEQCGLFDAWWRGLWRPDLAAIIVLDDFCGIPRISSVCREL